MAKRASLNWLFIKLIYLAFYALDTWWDWNEFKGQEKIFMVEVLRMAPKNSDELTINDERKSEKKPRAEINEIEAKF